MRDQSETFSPFDDANHPPARQSGWKKHRQLAVDPSCVVSLGLTG